MIPVYNSEIRTAVNLIQNIKEILGSKLPIVSKYHILCYYISLPSLSELMQYLVCHSGDELSQDAIRMFKEKFGVMVMDLNNFIDVGILGT